MCQSVFLKSVYLNHLKTMAFLEGWQKAGYKVFIGWDNLRHKCLVEKNKACHLHGRP
jgi:hypothetical protein